MISFAPSTRRPARTRPAIAVAAVLLCSAGHIAPAGASNLCIAMSGSGGEVAGLQLDLKWDANCMSADPGSGTGAQCTAESQTGKSVSSSVMPGPTLRALLFSMSDVRPIPDGNLFCCKFTRSSTATNTCCGLTMGNVRGSDPTGKAQQSFTLLASMDGQPCTASEGQAPQAQQPARSGLQGGGGAAPPVVSAPGAAPAAGAPQAPAGGQPAAPSGGGRAGAPAVGGLQGIPPANLPAGNVTEGEVPAGMDQVQRALQQLTPREAPTPGAATPPPEATPQRTSAAGTPTAKARATEGLGTPTAKAVTTPSPATTPEAKAAETTPNETPKATPKAKHKGKKHHKD